MRSINFERTVVSKVGLWQGRLKRAKQSTYQAPSFPRRWESSLTNAVIPTQVGIHHDATMDQYYVYILASQRNGTLYIGMTNNLIRRVWEHKTDAVDGFTKKYGVHRLVWYEIAETPEAAITREKQLKKWNRAWKLRLIEEMNPEWKDLYDEITR